MAVLWLAAVLIAITSNLDNLTVGIALGLRPLRVTVVTNVAIAVLTMIGTAAAMSLGSALRHALPQARAGLLGGLALIGIGAWMTLTGFAGLRRSVTASPPGPKFSSRGILRDPRRVATAHPPGATLTGREALLLGVALALNNVASGVPAGAAGLPPVLVTSLAGAFSLLAVAGGARLGAGIGARLAGRWAPTLAGVVLVAVGAIAASR